MFDFYGVVYNVKVANNYNDYFNIIFNNYDTKEANFIQDCQDNKFVGTGVHSSKTDAIDKAKYDLVNHLFGFFITTNTSLSTICHKNNDIEKCSETFEKYIKESYMGNLSVKTPIKIKTIKNKFHVKVKSQCTPAVYEDIVVNKLKNVLYHFDNIDNKKIIKKD